MKIKEEFLEGVHILFLKGKLDSSSVKVLKIKVNQIIKKQEPDVVIDLDGIDFIDSSGLGSLVASYRKINQVGGDVKLSSPSDQTRGLIELTRMDKLFDIYGNPFKAAESFGKTVAH
jgi:anti-anti-sigma factor